MVNRVYQGGPSNAAASYLPAGVPVDGDTIDTNGLPFEVVADMTAGLDNGNPAISNPAQFPAGAEAAPITVMAGVTLTLRGRIANSNGDLNLQPGSSLIYTNSDAQVQDFGDFDNAASAPTLDMDGAIAAHTGAGSMLLRIDGGGAVRLVNSVLSGFGDGNDVINALAQSDPSNGFYARNSWFVQSKGKLNLRFWGDGSMGDIDIDLLGNIDPVSGGGVIHIDGSADAALHTTTNVRSVKNLRAEGDLQMRYMQGYTSLAGLRIAGQPLTISGNDDASDCSGWLIGNHDGSFMRAIGSLTNSYFRDIGNNPHSISLARLKSQFPVFSGNIFDLQGIEGSTDTGDCLATDAAAASTDFLVAGQEITITDNLVLPTRRTGPNDGPIFVTLNGFLHPGVHVANAVKLRLTNNTGLFSNGGHVLNVDEHASAGASLPDTIIEHKRNVWSNHDAQSPMAISRMLRGLAGASDDVITLAQSDENVFHLYPDGLGIRQSATGNHDLATSSDAPDFGDATRNMEQWGLRCHQLEEEDTIAHLVRAGFPGYGPTPAVDATGFDLEAMRQWIRAGYVDRNPAHAGRGITDAAPIEMTDPMPLVDGEDETLDFDNPVTITEAFLYDPETQETTPVTLNTKPGPASELITSVQGDIPHGKKLLLGVKL